MYSLYIRPPPPPNSNTRAYSITKSYFGFGSGLFSMDNMECTGSEENIAECKHEGWSNIASSCTTARVAGVQCSDETDLDVRLVGGHTSSEGQVEVLFQGQWRSICDNNWGPSDAHVVCKQLALGYCGARAVPGSYFGTSASSFLLDNVQCSGQEDNVGHCQHSGWDIVSFTCDSSKAAGVKCTNQSGTIFFLEYSDSTTSGGFISSLSSDGVQRRITSATGDGADSLVIDSVAGLMFYTTHWLRGICRAEIKNIPMTNTRIWTATTDPHGLALCTRDQVVFVEHYDDVVMLTYNGTLLDTVDVRGGQSHGLAVDELNRILYFTDSNANKIWKVSFSTNAFNGRAAVILSFGAGDSPSGILFEGGTLYWISSSTGEIRSMSSTGNMSTIVVPAVNLSGYSSHYLAKDFYYFYYTRWISDGGVYRVSAGGRREKLTTKTTADTTGIALYSV